MKTIFTTDCDKIVVRCFSAEGVKILFWTHFYSKVNSANKIGVRIDYALNCLIEISWDRIEQKVDKVCHGFIQNYESSSQKFNSN